MRTYLAILRGALMEGMAYRMGFFFTLLGNLLYLCVAYFLWHSIYENTTTIHGLTFNDTFIYVGLGSTMFVLLKTFADWQIANEIADGSISIYLTKPVDYELYALFISLGSVMTTLVIISFPALVVMVLIFKVTFVLGPGLLLFPVSLLLAFMISFCFDYVTGLMAFYTESIWGISTTKEILISILAGALVPLQFFPEAIQNILRVLPFQAIYYTPLMMITRPNQEWGTLFSALGVQAFWVVALFILTRLFYNQAIKVLRVAGG
jgi:ABC-2 type transport system permease protein